MSQAASAQAYTIGRHVTQATFGTAYGTLHTVIKKRGLSTPVIVIANLSTASGTFAVAVVAVNVGTATASANHYASGASIGANALPIYIPIADLSSGDVVHIKGNANGITAQLLAYERS